MTTKTKRRGLIVLGTFAFLILFIVGSCTWVKKSSTKIYNDNIVQAPFDAIIVPGIPYDTALAGNGAILFKSRMIWSKQLFDRGVTKNIIYSGSAVHSPYHEGKTMKLIADSLGIPSQHTFVEGDALHSDENVVYGLRVAEKLGFKKVAVATDPFQIMFLKKIVAKKRLNVALLPLNVDSMPIYRDMVLPSINTESVFVQNFVPLKDRD